MRNKHPRKPTPAESKAALDRMILLDDGTRGLLSPEVYVRYKEWLSKPENIARLRAADDNKQANLENIKKHLTSQRRICNDEDAQLNGNG